MRISVCHALCLLGFCRRDGLAVLLLLIRAADPYKVNDPISRWSKRKLAVSKRKWHHIGKGNNPRFKVDSFATIVPPYSRQDYQTTKAFKVMFAFSNHKFLIPWILLADGNGLYLKKNYFLSCDTMMKIFCQYMQGKTSLSMMT